MKMTTRSKMILIASMLLAVGIIASTIPLLRISLSSETVNIQTLVFSLSIILLGIISVPSVYFSKIRKDKIEKQLINEYFSEYEIIKEIIMNSQLENQTKKEIRNDVLDIMISAQNHGKPIKSVIGDSWKFANEVIDEYGKLGRYNLLDFIDSMIFMSFFILGSSIVMWLEEIDKSFFDVKFDIGMIGFFAMISFIIVPLMKKNSVSKNPVMVFVPIGSGVLFVLIMELMRNFFAEVEFIKWFLDGGLSIISNVFILISLVVVIPGLMLLKKYLKMIKKRTFIR
jgi:DNA-binding ferritin-like protein (Dps family)